MDNRKEHVYSTLLFSSFLHTGFLPRIAVHARSTTQTITRQHVHSASTLVQKPRFLRRVRLPYMRAFDHSDAREASPCSFPANLYAARHSYNRSKIRPSRPTLRLVIPQPRTVQQRGMYISNPVAGPNLGFSIETLILLGRVEISKTAIRPGMEKEEE